MNNSILTSVKRYCNLEEDDHDFDDDIIPLINSEIAKLYQIGVGSDDVFSIEDDTSTWSDYIQDPVLLGMIPNYVKIQVKLVFDPPQQTSVSEALKKQADELEYRINLRTEIY